MDAHFFATSGLRLLEELHELGGVGGFQRLPGWRGWHGELGSAQTSASRAFVARGFREVGSGLGGRVHKEINSWRLWGLKISGFARLGLTEK